MSDSMHTSPVPESTHVIVIGTGLAGHAAAIEAYRRGARVTMIEKEQRTGGNSAKATSGINGAWSDAQRAQGIEDTVKSFAEDTVRAGHHYNDNRLVNVLTTQSKDALEWLASFGLDLSELSQCGGHARPRTHRFRPDAEGRAPPVGWGIVTALAKHVAELPDDRVQVLLGHRAVRLLKEVRHAGMTVSDLSPTGAYQTVCGVEVETSDGEGGLRRFELRGDAVVLTSGGYAYTKDVPDSLLMQFAPHLAWYPTTNGAFAVGQGIKMGMEAGAAVVGMDHIQVHPTGFVMPSDPDSGHKFLAPEALRGVGGILLGHRGRRFANELAPRDSLTAAINANAPEDVPVGKRTATLVMSPEAAAQFGMGAVGFYASKGLLRKVSGAAAVAAEVGDEATEAAVREALAEYARGAEAGEDKFGRPSMPHPPAEDGDYYVATITPSIHYTMGGLRIDSSAQVLYGTSHGTYKPILGLLAAGEVAGGVHGGNRLAGNSLLECVVFGRIAGQRAAMSAATEDNCGLHPGRWTSLRLRHKTRLSDTVAVYSFELPRPWQATGLALGQYISVRAALGDEGECVRYYSPVSRPDDHGVIELLVKADGKGCMSMHLADMEVGATLDFRGPMGGIDLTHSKVTKIGLVAGGVGISPMISILRHVLHNEQARRAAGQPPVEVRLLYGAQVEDELVFRDELAHKARQHPCFTMHLALDRPPDGWTGHAGFIDGPLVQRTMFPPGDDVRIILCGPWGMCQALKPVFAGIGYTSDMFYSYM